MVYYLQHVNGSNIPRTPPPAPTYVERTRSRGNHRSPNAELLARYESMRERMSQLSAMGLIRESSWESESSATHLRMTTRHLSRAIVLLAVNTLRLCFCMCAHRKEQKRKSAT